MLPSQPVTKNSNSVDLFLISLYFSYVKWAERLSGWCFPSLGASGMAVGGTRSPGIWSLHVTAGGPGPGQLCQKGDGFSWLGDLAVMGVSLPGPSPPEASVWPFPWGGEPNGPWEALLGSVDSWRGGHYCWWLCSCCSECGFTVHGEGPGGSLCLYLCQCQSVDMSVILLNPEVLERGFKIF